MESIAYLVKLANQLFVDYEATITALEDSYEACGGHRENLEALMKEFVEKGYDIEIQE
jgi:hypothetical protein